MLRLLTPALAILILAAPAGTAADPKAPSYYPLGDGNTWEYQVTTKGKKQDASTRMKAIERDKKTVYELESKFGDATIKEELSADDKGVYRTTVNGAKAEPALKIIRYPVKPGKWSDTITLDGQETDFTMTVEEPVEVKVPAGTYKALPVKMIAKTGDTTVAATTWYAENVGIVKQVISIAGTEATLELTKFTPGK